MFEDENTLFNSVEKKIKEIANEQEAQERQMSEYFNQLGISQEEVQTYLNNQENFSPKDWELMQTIRAKLDEKLESKLNEIRAAAEKREAKAPLPHNAIYVR